MFTLSTFGFDFAVIKVINAADDWRIKEYGLDTHFNPFYDHLRSFIDNIVFK